MTPSERGPSILYERFCGPRALAALTGITPRHAGSILADATRFLGRVPDYHSTSGGALAFAFMSLGHGVELWEPTADGRLRMGADEYRDFLTRAPSPPRPRPAPPTPERRRDIRRALEELDRADPPPAPRWVTVRECLELHPLGDWLVHVGGREDGHVMAARDGRIVSGGDGPPSSPADSTCWPDGGVYRDERVVDLHRVLPPERKTE